MKRIILGIFAMLIAAIVPVSSAFASQFSLSPMYQFVSLIPGETYVGNFEIVNPGDSQHDFSYTIEVKPFSVDDEGETHLTANGDYNKIVDWITVFPTEGTVSPNQNKEIRFTIDVPEDAPAGGQYASIVVSSGEYHVDNNTVDLREIYQAAHLIYADVAGETVRKGTVEKLKVPSFMFSGNIIGSAMLKNEGNVHSMAKQTLQIFPFFSKEEIYTNEENPKEIWIMPGNSIVSATEWKETPSMGIFHVIYNVEYEGVTKGVDKYVIICPIWLLVIILAIIFLILFKILFTGKGEKKEKR